jgi:hypothetical protein
MNEETKMSKRANGRFPIRFAAAAFAAVMASFAARLGAAPGEQKSFATPEQAVKAAVQAAAADDAAALTAIFGPESKDMISTGDSVQDKKARENFVRLAREKTAITVDPSDSGRATFSIGPNDWPSPVPIVQKDGKWMFDSKEGAEELLLRLIGRNELNTIALLRGYDEAQMEYALADPDKTGVHQYAQRLISTPGKRDGLYWKAGDGEPESPIGEAVANALEEGYSKKTEPYHGYFFKVLKGQGPAAPLGQLDYVISGHMIGGFALVAWPAKHRATGVMTFLVSNDGIVYQKDLGPDTATIAPEMTRYNPDEGWVATEDEESDSDDDGDDGN